MITNLFLILYQIGSSCVYVVFIASNLKAVSFPRAESIDFFGDGILFVYFFLCVRIFKLFFFSLQIGDYYLSGSTDVRMYMIYILVPLILICWIRNLKLLAPFSSFATCLTLVSFTLIFYYIFREAPSFEGREPVGTIKSIPLFFGTVLFAMEAIGMVSKRI